MKHAVIFLLTILVLIVADALAQEVETLDAAKKLSVQTGKPILMEFVHTD